MSREEALLTDGLTLRKMDVRKRGLIYFCIIHLEKENEP